MRCASPGCSIRLQPRPDDRQPLTQVGLADDPASQQRVRQGDKLILRIRQVRVPGGRQLVLLKKSSGSL